MRGPEPADTVPRSALRAGIEAEQIGKHLTAQFHALAQCQYVLGKRIVDDAARKEMVSSDVGKLLVQPRFDCESQLGSHS